ncbi:hypothetical protein Agabi119p4_10463 [Agaricus bisporus var. burnettii]|uniref:Uncharacterized protein n=1 Tax=Agaricus bisporus var. burnettii TaxID=192524 RepID=A0A8H7C1L4_AGABI|nr:hypothetical protein Agabi119p4_10463 [Agaricus bisporus var. burnettii]
MIYRSTSDVYETGPTAAGTFGKSSIRRPVWQSRRIMPNQAIGWIRIPKLVTRKVKTTFLSAFMILSGCRWIEEACVPGDDLVRCQSAVNPLQRKCTRRRSYLGYQVAKY